MNRSTFTLTRLGCLFVCTGVVLLDASFTHAMTIAVPQAVAANVSKSQLNDFLRNSTAQTMPFPSLNVNRTVPSTAILMNTNYRCIPDLGSGLSAIGCEQALSALNEDDDIRKSWGPRGVGMMYAFDLPQRWVSRMCSSTSEQLATH